MASKNMNDCILVQSFFAYASETTAGESDIEAIRLRQPTRNGEQNLIGKTLKTGRHCIDNF
jgi:hypothetical protein